MTFLMGTVDEDTQKLEQLIEGRSGKFELAAWTPSEQPVRARADAGLQLSFT